MQQIEKSNGSPMQHANYYATVVFNKDRKRILLHCIKEGSADPKTMKSIETDITVFKGNFQKILILIDASFKQQT